MVTGTAVISALNVVSAAAAAAAAAAVVLLVVVVVVVVSESVELCSAVTNQQASRRNFSILAQRIVNMLHNQYVNEHSILKVLCALEAVVIEVVVVAAVAAVIWESVELSKAVRDRHYANPLTLMFAGSISCKLAANLAV